MDQLKPPPLDFSDLDLINQEMKETNELSEKLSKFKDILPEKEYIKMFDTEQKLIHEKYKKLRKELKKRKN